MAGSWAFSHTFSLSGPPQASRAEVTGTKKKFIIMSKKVKIFFMMIHGSRYFLTDKATSIT